MTEAVAVTNDFWFDVLGFHVLRTSKAVANIASRRISEKTGMRVVAIEEHQYVLGRLPTEIWELTRERWLACRAHILPAPTVTIKASELRAKKRRLS